MWKNYLKIAWRNINRSKGFAFINIGGLGIGIAASVLILIWIQFELSIDRFYTHSDRVYAVWRNTTIEGEVMSWDYTPAPYGPAMKDKFPEVEETTRLTEWDPHLLTVGSNSFYEKTTFVDPGFFKLFTFEVISGDTEAALSVPDGIILTQSVAKKLFGDEDPMGKTVVIEKQLDFKVLAIIEDLPQNSNFEYTAFLPFKKLESMGWADPYWGNNSYRTFALLHKGVDLKDFNEKYSGFTAMNTEDKNVSDFLFPVSDLHLYSKFENGMSVGGRIELIRLFGGVAIIVLVLACINFINLSTAQSENRAKEVGVRKISGAGKGMLVWQFLVESVLIAFFAYGFAMTIVAIALPHFSNFIGKELQSPFNQPEFWLISLAYIMFIGLLAGSYPAFLMSSFKPTVVFKLKWNTRKYWVNPREALVVFQFAVVAILISSAWIIRDQMHHVQNRDLGLDKENLIYHQISGTMQKNMVAFRNELLALEEVNSVSYTFSPITELHSDTNMMKWQGKEDSYTPTMYRMGTDANLVETAGFELVSGRDIDVYTFPSDSNAVLINETAAKTMGFDDPLGQVIQDDELSFTVVGVVKDFIMGSPFEEVLPILVFGPKRNLSFIHVRLNPGDNYSEMMANVASVFAKFNPGAPFDYNFVDEVHARKFESQKRTAELTGLFTALAVLISCMGLFGLASFIAEQRRKEISVRKVLGASIPGLVRLISSQFTKLVLIAVLMGIPVTWYFMNSWLETFDYRISIDWKIFLWTAITAMLIAFLTVSSQAIKTAMVNPSKVLKSE